jgi:hypothetical protein
MAILADGDRNRIRRIGATVGDRRVATMVSPLNDERQPMRTTLLFIHIASAGAWLGGNFTQIVVGPMLQRREPNVAAAWFRATVDMGTRLYTPAGVILLITGIWQVLTTGYEFEDPFVVIGILAIAVGITLGVGVFGPQGSKAAEFAEQGDAGALAVVRRKLMGFGALDTLVILFAMWAMVKKLGV